MDNILEKGVSYFIIDSFLKAVRDNTVGNPGGNPDQAVSMGFSNVSRLISVAIGESVVKHFYLQHDDVTLVQKLTEQHFRAIEAAAKQRLIDGLQALKAHPAASIPALQQAYQFIEQDFKPPAASG